MNEMVERVAAAIKSALQAHGETEYVGEKPRLLNKTELQGDFDLHEVARAAIKAIREPTDAMREAGARPPFGEPGLSRDASTEVWQDMIDEALRD